jgi:phage-related protein
MKHILEFQDFNSNKELNLLDETDSFVEITESEFLELFSQSLFEKAPTTNTVKGGIFDMNDAETYKWVKNAKSMIIDNVKYTFISIGDGIKQAAEKAEKGKKATAEGLKQMAKYAGKTVIYAAAGIYVASNEIANGIYSLVASILSMVKKGAIKLGSGIATAAKNVNVYMKAKGASALQSIKSTGDGILEILKNIMSALYSAAKTAQNVAQTVATLTVAAYKSAKTYFKEVKNFATDCIFNVAKSAKVWVANKAENIKDAYNAAVEKIQKEKDSVVASIKKGYDDYKNKVESTAKKALNYADKLKTKAGKEFKDAQNKIILTGKEIESQIKAIWGGLFDSENFPTEGIEEILESYVMRAGEKYYVLPY